jgi:acyl-coenzyme A synthetase/AMP-(fatty) acid ligase
VESTLQAHPAIIEAVVIATPDSNRGSAVKAFVVLDPHVPVQSETELKMEIKEHCLQRMAAYNCPSILEIVDRSFLPRTVSGKTIRKALREREQK